jgi:hypothetical protein
MAVEMLDQGLVRAVRTHDENRAATVLIERARCLIQLQRFALAEQNLRTALAHDTTRVDARALLQACLERTSLRAEIPTVEESPQPANVAAPVATNLKPAPLPRPRAEEASSRALPGLALVDRVTTPLDIDSADLLNAGRNLQAIYSGLRKVLQKGAGVAPPAEGPSSTPGSEQ